MNIKIQYDAGDFSVNTTQISNLTKQEHNKSCAYEIIINLYIKKCEKVKTTFRRKITKKTNIKTETGLTKVIKSFIRHVLLFHKCQTFEQ
jgi:hypothetical protein